jgi:hypothetical protein
MDARNPSLQLLHQLAARIGCDPHWLATGKKPDSHDELVVRLQAVERERDELRRRLDQIAALSQHGGSLAAGD